MTPQENYLNFNKNKLDDLLLKSMNGDEKSFSELSKIIRDIAYSYFHSKFRLRKIKTIEEVEDMANNTYLVFAEQYKKIQNVENWLRRVLFLQFVNWYKKENKYQVFELDESYDGEESANIDENFEAQRLIDCLNKLTELKQEIIKLKFWGGFKFKEIAEMIKKNENAVKKMYYRTLEELKKICE